MKLCTLTTKVKSGASMSSQVVTLSPLAMITKLSTGISTSVKSQRVAQSRNVGSVHLVVVLLLSLTYLTLNAHVLLQSIAIGLQ